MSKLPNDITAEELERQEEIESEEHQDDIDEAESEDDETPTDE